MLKIFIAVFCIWTISAPVSYGLESLEISNAKILVRYSTPSKNKGNPTRLSDFLKVDIAHIGSICFIADEFNSKTKVFTTNLGDFTAPDNPYKKCLKCTGPPGPVSVWTKYLVNHAIIRCLLYVIGEDKELDQLTLAELQKKFNSAARFIITGTDSKRKSTLEIKDPNSKLTQVLTKEEYLYLEIVQIAQNSEDKILTLQIQNTIPGYIFCVMPSEYREWLRDREDFLEQKCPDGLYCLGDPSSAPWTWAKEYLDAILFRCLAYVHCKSNNEIPLYSETTDKIVKIPLRLDIPEPEPEPEPEKKKISGYEVYVLKAHWLERTNPTKSLNPVLHINLNLGSICLFPKEYNSNSTETNFMSFDEDICDGLKCSGPSGTTVAWTKQMVHKSISRCISGLLKKDEPYEYFTQSEFNEKFDLFDADKFIIGTEDSHRILPLKFIDIKGHLEGILSPEKDVYFDIEKRHVDEDKRLLIVTTKNTLPHPGSSCLIPKSMQEEVEGNLEHFKTICQRLPSICYARTLHVSKSTDDFTMVVYSDVYDDVVHCVISTYSNYGVDLYLQATGKPKGTRGALIFKAKEGHQNHHKIKDEL